jgi:hypothetical protein
MENDDRIDDLLDTLLGVAVAARRPTDPGSLPGGLSRKGGSGKPGG